MSDFVVHFTKPIPAEKIHRPPPKDPDRPTHAELFLEARARLQEGDSSGYYPWIDILGEGRLRPGEKPLGAGRKVPGVENLHRVVCFSEIPLDLLDRLIEKRTLYGIGFHKDLLVEKGGSPLWYLAKDCAQAAAVQDQVDAAQAGGVDPDDPIWKLTPFIDHPGTYNGVPYRFEWEREWRVVGDFTFAPDDVAFIFLPGEDHEKAEQFFAEVQAENSGPAYLGPYLDPGWGSDEIQKAIAEI